MGLIWRLFKDAWNTAELERFSGENLWAIVVISTLKIFKTRYIVSKMEVFVDWTVEASHWQNSMFILHFGSILISWVEEKLLKGKELNTKPKF